MKSSNALCELDPRTDTPARTGTLHAVSSPCSELEPVRRLSAEGGACAVVVGSSGSERIEVRDHEDQVLFELDTVTGRAIVRQPKGSLSLEAPEGDIELRAGGSVRCRGERVELEAGGRGAALVLAEDCAKLTAKGLTFAAERASAVIGEVRHVGARFEATLQESKLAAKRIERVAESLFERARNAFRTTEELEQLEAGRVRTVVEGAHVVRAGHAHLLADEEVTIDGSRINLG